MSLLPQRLYLRLALAFALLLCVFAVALYVAVRASADDFRREVTQRLSYPLAGFLRDEWKLSGNPAADPPDLETRLAMLGVYHPGVEASVLDAAGRVRVRTPGTAGPDAYDLAPVRRFLAGEALPISGSDASGQLPRHVFSVAPLGDPAQPAGYLYLALEGSDAQALVAELRKGESVHALGLSIIAVFAASLALGLAIFHLATRRLRTLAARVEHLYRDDLAPMPAVRDEIAALDAAFDALDARIAHQLDTIAAKDRQRRDTVRMVSHDLRTPLTTLRGYLDTLADRYETLADADRRRYLDVAARQCTRLSRLTEQLFQLARLDCGDITPVIEPFCIADLAQDLLGKFELTAGKRGISLEARTLGRAWVDADIGLIERALENLLDNALRHTDAGGAVTLEIVPQGNTVGIGVRDTGSGIAPAQLAQLFDSTPAERRDGDRPWGGVGLAVVRCIVQLHGGELCVESAPGLGSHFHFRLAAAQPDARVVSLHSSGSSQRRSGEASPV